MPRGAYLAADTARCAPCLWWPMSVWIDEAACVVDKECCSVRVSRPYSDQVVIETEATDGSRISVRLAPEDAERFLREARRVIRSFAREAK